MTEAGLDHRHRAVPLARAGARRPGRPALRPLLGRDRPLRDADRNGAVRRRHAGRDRDEAPLRRPRRPRRSGPTCRASSTRSSCARSRRTRTSATTRPRRWTPTSRGRARDLRLRRDGGGGDAGALAAPASARLRRRSCPAAAAMHAVPPRALLRVRRAAAPQDDLAVAARRLLVVARGRRRLAVCDRVQDQLNATKPVRGARRRGPDGAAGGRRHPDRRAGGARPRRPTRPTSRPASSSRTRRPANGPSGATSSRSSSRRAPKKVDGARRRRPEPRRGGGGAHDAGLKADVVPVNSLEPGHRAREAPKAGTGVVKGTKVRINVSSGPEAGHGPERHRQPVRGGRSRRSRAPASRSLAEDVESNEPPGRGRPEPGCRHAAGKGARDHALGLAGAAASQVPDVTSQTEADARAELEARLRGPVVEETSTTRAGRARALAGAGGRHGRGGGHDGGDRRRPLRGSATARAATDRPRPSPAVSRIRVAVLTGGRSSEHEISLASARSVMEALDPARYEVTQIAIGRDGRWALAAPRTRRQ